MNLIYRDPVLKCHDIVITGITRPTSEVFGEEKETERELLIWKVFLVFLISDKLRINFLESMVNGRTSARMQFKRWPLLPGVGLPYKTDGNARRNFQKKPLKVTILGVTPANFFP